MGLVVALAMASAGLGCEEEEHLGEVRVSVRRIPSGQVWVHVNAPFVVPLPEARLVRAADQSWPPDVPAQEMGSSGTIFMLDPPPGGAGASFQVVVTKGEESRTVDATLEAEPTGRLYAADGQLHCADGPQCNFSLVGGHAMRVTGPTGASFTVGEHQGTLGSGPTDIEIDPAAALTGIDLAVACSDSSTGAPTLSWPVTLTLPDGPVLEGQWQLGWTAQRALIGAAVEAARRTGLSAPGTGNATVRTWPGLTCYGEVHSLGDIGRGLFIDVQTRERSCGPYRAAGRSGSASLTLVLLDATAQLVDLRTRRQVGQRRFPAVNTSCPSGFEGTGSAQLQRRYDAEALDGWIQAQVR